MALQSINSCRKVCVQYGRTEVIVKNLLFKQTRSYLVKSFFSVARSIVKNLPPAYQGCI